MDISTTLRDNIRVAEIGMTDHETKSLRSMFGLVPALSSRYDLLDSNSRCDADIVIVNADNPLAASWYRTLKKKLPHVKCIYATRNREPISSNPTVRRPIQYKHLVAALEKITSTSNDKNSRCVESSTTALRVLVVDDSYPVRTYMKQKLAELAPVITDIALADSGESAMQLIWNTEFDLVFLDVSMPGIDGYSVCKAIKKGNFAYVVMLTGNSSPFDRIKGSMSGCDGYLTKPPSDEKLVAQIVKCLEGRDAVYECNPNKLETELGI